MANQKKPGKSSASSPKTRGSLTRRTRKKMVDARDEKAQLLLEATEKFISNGHSFIELSVDQLCREAGISRSTYYVYFEDKTDLLRALAVKIADEMVYSSRRWFDAISHATIEQFREAISDTLRVYRKHKAVFKSLAETASYDQSVGEAFNKLLETYTQQWLEAATAGIKAGVIRDDVDGPTLLALVWMFERISYRMLQGDDGEEQLAKATDISTNIAWRTLYKHP